VSEPKQRVVVMNGQRILQSLQGEDWEPTQVSEGTGGLRPSIINLYRAVDADPAKTYTDERFVFQQVPAGIVRYERSGFQELPDIGANVSVSLEQGEAKVAAAGQAHSTGISIR
jgi:hypothetical protein